MTPEEVPDELVQAAADVLKQNGLWGAWERHQTEDEARSILAAVLPLHEQQLREQIAGSLSGLPIVQYLGLTTAHAASVAEAAQRWMTTVILHPDQVPGEQPILSYGLTAQQHAVLEAAARNAAAVLPPRPRLTVVVTGYPREFDRWCYENHRNPRDRTIIRISDGYRDQYKLHGIAEDFDVVVLSEIPHHNEAMTLISHRLATAPRKDSSQ